MGKKNRGKNPKSIGEHLDMEKLLGKLESPFNWGMDMVEDEIDYQVQDEERMIPLINLFHNIMNLVLSVRIEKSLDRILKILDECHDILRVMQQ